MMIDYKLGRWGSIWSKYCLPNIRMTPYTCFGPYKMAKTLLNNLRRKFFKNAQNAEIYHGEFFLVMHVLTHIKCPKHL